MFKSRNKLIGVAGALAGRGTIMRRVITIAVAAVIPLLGFAAPVLADPSPPSVQAFNAPLIADVAGGYVANGAPNFCYLEFPVEPITVTGLKGNPKDQYYIQVNPGIAISGLFTKDANGVPQPMSEFPAPVFPNPQATGQPVTFTTQVWQYNGGSAPDTLVTQVTAQNTQGCV